MRRLPTFCQALPVDEELFGEDIYVTHAGHEVIPPGCPNYPLVEHPRIYHFNWHQGRVMPDFCLAAILKGSGLVETREYPQSLRAGQCFFYFPGQWHRHRPSLRQGWTIIWIFFNGLLPLRWFRKKAFHLEKNSPIPIETNYFLSQFHHVVRSAYDYRLTNSTVLSWEAAGLISQFLVDTRPASKSETDPISDPVVARAVEYIWNFSHNHLDVAAVVETSGLNRRTLERRFQKVIGRGILAEIHHCRLSRATRLLHETSMPIKHIVERSGFPSREAMRLSFQKEFGQPPESIRDDEP